MPKKTKILPTEVPSAVPSTEALPETAPAETKVTENEKIRAAFNLPADQFQLGERVFTIHDLPYDDYVQFLSLCEPFIQDFVGNLMPMTGIVVPGINIRPEKIDISAIIKSLSKVLPELVCIMCKQSDPDITVAEVKLICPRPVPMATAVFKQIKQNGMIKDFADFFVQMATMLKKK